MTQIYDNGATNSTAKDLKDTFLQINPLSFSRIGYIDYFGGTFYNRASSGFYWLFNHLSRTRAYNFYFGSHYLNPQYDYGRGNGFAIRCLARQQIKRRQKLRTLPALLLILYVPKVGDYRDMRTKSRLTIY